ncbi:MAG: putative hydrolase of the superfamily [Solirubrobacteraceae bacterium]|jgi:putative hydrolase of the HAD superfamily|nr:putative hydrolase of the superfamily [Solirubrobacteraceae bacterium]
MSDIRAVISDFGGVLTSPLLHSFAAYQDSSGISVEALGNAMVRIAEADGAHPLFELETGRLSEAEFLARMGRELSADLGREIELHGFAEAYFGQLDPNEDLLEYMRSLRHRGFRMAVLTNNVREWQPLWRPVFPIDEIFELVVDSGFVGMRKPDREIYELTLERLGLRAEECLFVDDTDVNVDAARELGMTAVHFRSSEQAIGDIEAALEDARPRASAG